METGFQEGTAPGDFKPCSKSSAYTFLKVVDTVALLKELELLKGKQLCLMMDLTPCLKRSIYGVGLAYSWVEDGEPKHRKVLLPKLIPSSLGLSLSLSLSPPQSPQLACQPPQSPQLAHQPPQSPQLPV